MTAKDSHATITFERKRQRRVFMIGIYVRISDDDQSQYSISDQTKECRMKAGSDEIIEYIDNGVSGAILERPALNKLRDDVKSGIITKVICWDPDRLSRELMYQLIIANEIEKRAVLEFVNHNYQKTPEGILFFQMRGAFSQFEKAKIAERTSRGRREKGSQSKVIKNSQMYGYDYDKETSMYTINENESNIVKIIFNLFTVPNHIVKGINGIAKYLTEQGVETKRGASVWHRQVVRQILLNEAYTGNYAQNKWNTEGMVGNKYIQKSERVTMTMRPQTEWLYVSIPQIIDEIQFQHAQRLLEVSQRRFTNQSINKYLLSGLLRCGECGNTMTGRRSKNWSRYEFEYVDIKHTAGAKFKGCGMKVKRDVIEKNVWETILNWLNDPAEIAASAEEVEVELFDSNESDRLEKEIEKCRSKRKNLVKLFSMTEDEFDQDNIKEEMRMLAEKEKTLIKSLELLNDKKIDDHTYEVTRKTFIDAAEYYLSKGVDELTFEDRQELIRTVVKEIKVYKDHIDIISF